MVRNLLIQVISSWQIWVVTVVLVIYISIVKAVSNLNSRRRKAPLPKAKKSTPNKGAAPAPKKGPAPKKDDLGMDEVEIEEQE